MSLASRTCVACEGGLKKLQKAEVDRLRLEVPTWAVAKDGKRIARTFKFEEFAPAMVFVNKVAKLAEREGHHPDIHVHWNQVELVLWTHAIGGLHENDFILAAKIDRLK